jgi:hypothetical protein
MHYGFSFIAFRMVFIPCYIATRIYVAAKYKLHGKIYGLFYSFGYTNIDIAPFGLVAQLFLFDLTHKLILFVLFTHAWVITRYICFPSFRYKFTHAWVITRYICLVPKRKMHRLSFNLARGAI